MNGFLTMRMSSRLCRLLLASACLAGFPALAGELSHDDLSRRFPPPLHVGEKLRDVPAWPLTSELTPDSGPVGYVFESIDLAPIPGFEGTPFDLLIALDRKGNFIDVTVLREHEPVFLGGLGEAPLHAFVGQYAGRNLRQEITVSTAYGNVRSGAGENRVVLDGVAKATASVRIVNQTVLTAALAVARAKLGFAAPGQRGPPAKVREDFFESKDFAGLLRDGDIVRKRWTNRDVEALFAGSAGAGVDPQALAAPDEVFADLLVAYVSAPTLGRAVLGDDGYAALMRRLEPGQHAYWIASAGRYSLLDAGFVRGTEPQRLSLNQDGAPVEMRDADLELRPPAGAPSLNAMVVLRAPPMAGLDPARSVDVALDVIREKGQILPIVTHKSLTVAYEPPARYFVRPPAPLPEWLLAWKARAVDLAVLGTALLLLAVVLARPRAVSLRPRLLAAFRLGFLAFTVVYIGWYAQGQLSIVQVTGAVKTLATGQGLTSFLYDPISLLLIAATALSFVVWGRGTFCGWLCPFGALQEFINLAARRVGLKDHRLPGPLARVLDRGRYVLLALLVGAAVLAPGTAEYLVEVEPFKTAITVGFARQWPFVLYAVLMLLVGVFYYKFFCRFVCPLGAAITLGGKLRRFDWLPRRAECGKPCQTCRNICEYDAIAPDGKIRYDDCFQCLDCVGIYHDDRRCAPLIFYRRTGRTTWGRDQASRNAAA